MMDQTITVGGLVAFAIFALGIGMFLWGVLQFFAAGMSSNPSASDRVTRDAVVDMIGGTIIAGAVAAVWLAGWLS